MLTHYLCPWLVSLPNQPFINVDIANAFPERACRKENHPDVTCFTKGLAGLPYISEMAQKTLPSPLSPKADVRVDYALIATGVGSALFALIYLILI